MAAKDGQKGVVTGVGLDVRVVDHFLTRWENDHPINISQSAAFGEFARFVTETDRQTREDVLTSNARPAIAVTSNGKRIRGKFSSLTAPVGASLSIAIFELEDINTSLIGLTPDFITTGVTFPLYFDYTVTSKIAVVALRYNTPPPSAITDGALRIFGQIDN